MLGGKRFRGLGRDSESGFGSSSVPGLVPSLQLHLHAPSLQHPAGAREFPRSSFCSLGLEEQLSTQPRLEVATDQEHFAGAGRVISLPARSRVAPCKPALGARAPCGQPNPLGRGRNSNCTLGTGCKCPQLAGTQSSGLPRGRVTEKPPASSSALPTAVHPAVPQHCPIGIRDLSLVASGQCAWWHQGHELGGTGDVSKVAVGMCMS